LKQCAYDSDNRSLTLAVAAEVGVSYTIEFIATKRNARAHASWNSPGVGEVTKRVLGTHAEYSLTKGDAFVRARVTSSRIPQNAMTSNYTGDATQFEQAFTQPVGWQRVRGH
jgi:hypothetical protein